MISRYGLEDLVGWKVHSGGRVLSVYLNLDQAKAVNRHRGFEVSLRNMLRSVEDKLTDDQEKRDFASNAERIGQSVSQHEASGKSLAVFCAESENLFWQKELKVPIGNHIYWNETPYVRPLMAAMDEFERYGVILTDRAQARLFTVFMGEIEEHHEALTEGVVRHIKTTSKDQMWSQKRFQRKAEEQARWHLKGVAEVMDRVARDHAFDRLVLAGPVEATSELRRLLPKRLQPRVVAALGLQVGTSEKNVREVTLAVEQEVEREAEEKLVEELVTAAAKGDQAVVGLEPTLGALQEGRIWKLIYAEDSRKTGGECPACSALVAGAYESCPYCAGAVHFVEDVVARLAERTIEVEGRFEQVRGTAAGRLREVGGVGAFLRY